MKTYTIQLADDEVLVALKRGERYDDVHPELISEDAIGDRWPEYRTIHGEALAELQPQDADMVLVPRVPTPGLLMSMALRYDHGLGLPGYYDEVQHLLPKGHPQKGITHARRLESTITTMRQLHEEVVGAGFYRPEREAGYAAQLAAAAPKP
ncbi:MAG TPA: hypothetical protein VIN03_11900 [Roseateles sp.]